MEDVPDRPASFTTPPRLKSFVIYLEHVTGNDPDKRDRLIKGLDVFLERDRDRELFELAPNKEIFDGNPG